jgi:hypothetical protein
MGPRPTSASKDPNSPDWISPSCEYMMRRSQLCRDLREGTIQMVSKAHQYLPRYEGETEEDWNNRVQFASLRNFYAQCVGSILGKMFAQPPRLNDDVPATIGEDLKDADLNGNDWTIVSENLVDAALDDGLSWLMVDYHTLPEVATGERELSLAEERSLGVRPYWVVVPQHKVLGVEYSYRDGVYTIEQFRYYTCIKRKAGLFGEEYIDQIRVIEPGLFRVFEKNSDSQWSELPATVNTLGMVPVVPLNLNETGQFEANPPLENLAHMNLEHFQIRSDQRRALSVASFPILATYGVDIKKGHVAIGPMSSFAFEDPKAKMQWVESQGIHLLAGDRELLRLEAQIRVFGLSFENPQMYATATARNIDASDAVAPIQRWAYRLRDTLNGALWYHAQWRKVKNGGTVNVNTAFLRNQITVEELKLLLEALKEGKISMESFLTRMREYGLLGLDFNPTEEIDRLINEAIKLAKVAQEQDDSDGSRREPESSEEEPEGSDDGDS